MSRARGIDDLRQHLLAGQVIPAHPLALTAECVLDERRQRALTRYYLAAGAGGIAVGVHTTQFAIRQKGLYAPVLELAAETMDAEALRPMVRIAGLCGETKQALAEAETALRYGYHAGLLSLAAWGDRTEEEIQRHCRSVAEAIPLFGFYLQPAVGGRVLSYRFWRELAEIPGLVAIKIAPFNRYQTLDVVRAVIDSGREDVALYTGNDDNILIDLLTRFGFVVDGRPVSRRIVGGLLGHWAVGTRAAVKLLEEIHSLSKGSPLDPAWLTRAAQVTEVNAALFDVANGFQGCIAGIHEVLRRQGLLAGTWCLDPEEGLSSGQAEEIDRVCRVYPDQQDDAFIAEHLEEWLR